MSRSRSVSLEIVPPKIRSPEIVKPSIDLAAVMDAVFKSNSKQNRDDGKGLDAEASNNLLPAAAGLAPNPCERCVRTKKACKGVDGARCEYCKRLKQRCSNSTGPARGKHAIPKQPKAYVATPSIPVHTSAGGSDSARWQDRPKRKASEKLSVSHNGNTDDGEGSDDDDDDDDEHDEVQQNANKKRRLSTSASGPGPSRTLLAKAVADMEASIKRVQTSVAKEVEKMKGIVKTLNAKIKEMDDD